MISGVQYFRSDYGMVQLDYPCDTAISAKTHYLRALHPNIKDDYAWARRSLFRGQDDPENMQSVHELCMLADCLYYGLFGCLDIQRATALYKFCNEAGYPRASHNLGIIHLKQGDHQNALSAFEKAARTRPDSCFNLALLHDDLRLAHENEVGAARDAHCPMPDDDKDLFAFPFEVAFPNYLDSLRSYAERGDANCGRYLEGKLYRAAFRSDIRGQFEDGFNNLKSRAHTGDPIAMSTYAWEGSQGSEKIWMKDRDFIQKKGPKDQGHLLYWLRLAALSNDANACTQYASLRYASLGSRDLVESEYSSLVRDLDLVRKAAGYGARAPQQVLGAAMMSGKLGLFLRDEGCFWWQLAKREKPELIRPSDIGARVPTHLFDEKGEQWSKFSNLHAQLMGAMGRARGEDIEARVQKWKPAPLDDYIDQVWWSNAATYTYLEVPPGQGLPRTVETGILAEPSFYDDAIEYADWL